MDARQMRTWISAILRLISGGAVIAAVIIAAAGGYCLWRGGCTLASFADNIINVGLLAAAAGALTTMGGATLGSHPTYQVARTAGEATSTDRTRQDVRASEGRLSCTLLLAVGAVEAALVGFAIRGIVGLT
jgi:hypothetical protein